MLNMDLLAFIDEMKQVSENVKDYLENEIYVDRFGAYSDSTSSDILMECIKIIIDELTSYGIVFSCESDYLEDFYNARKIVCLKKFILIDHWLLVFNENEDFLNEIETLVSNESGDPDTDLFDLILGKTQDATNFTEFESIADISADVYSDNRFKKYMNDVIKYIREKGPAVDINVAGQRDYINQIVRNRNWIKRFVDEIYLRERSNSHIDKRYLDYLVISYDIDKISASNIRLYQLVDKEDVPDNLIPLKNFLMDRHHQSIPHHVEYWCENGKADHAPRIEDIIILVVHNYEDGLTFDEFLKKHEKMISENENIFSGYARLIKVCVEAVKYILKD